MQVGAALLGEGRGESPWDVAVPALPGRLSATMSPWVII